MTEFIEINTQIKDDDKVALKIYYSNKVEFITISGGYIVENTGMALKANSL